MIIGYCRVSTDGQTLDAQIAELKAAGATRIFSEKQSGARTDRPQLRKALAALGKGDTLVVSRLDRLARSTRPAQYPARGFRARRGVQELSRRMVRYNDAAREADDNAARGYCRVRTFVDQGAH